MTITWVRTDNDSVFSAMEAAEKALVDHPTDTVEADIRVGDKPDPTGGDPYLAENFALVHNLWSINPHQIVTSQRPGLGRAINGFQQVVRRATWWYTLPQWLQISEFHGAVVRVMEAMLEHQRRANQQIQQNTIEGAYTLGHVRMLEQQILALQSEQEALLHRIAALEGQLMLQEQMQNQDEGTI